MQKNHKLSPPPKKKVYRKAAVRSATCFETRDWARHLLIPSKLSIFYPSTLLQLVVGFHPPWKSGTGRWWRTWACNNQEGWWVTHYAHHPCVLYSFGEGEAFYYYYRERLSCLSLSTVELFGPLHLLRSKFWFLKYLLKYQHSILRPISLVSSTFIKFTSTKFPTT